VAILNIPFLSFKLTSDYQITAVVNCEVNCEDNCLWWLQIKLGQG